MKNDNILNEFTEYFVSAQIKIVSSTPDENDNWEKSEVDGTELEGLKWKVGSSNSYYGTVTFAEGVTNVFAVFDKKELTTKDFLVTADDNIKYAVTSIDNVGTINSVYLIGLSDIQN